MDRTPVIIGVGEDFDLPHEELAAAKSNAALAAAAARAAIADAGAPGLAQEIDALAAVRTHPDSTPFWPHSVTPARNFPRAVARRIGIDPRLCVYDSVGGNSPQRLVGEFGARIANGEVSAVVIAGGDAIASEKAAQRAGMQLDWSDAADGEFEDRGLDVSGLLSSNEIANELVEIGAIYALFENARRARRGMSKEAYAREMAALLAPFSTIAARTEGAVSRRAKAVDEIAARSAENPMLYDPFTKAVMAKDGVNMGASIVMTSAGKARSLGVSEDKFVYLHGHCDTVEKPIMERPDLGASPAMAAAYRTALDRANVSVRDVRHFDFYSCFPVAVFAACEGLGVDLNDERAITTIGGLPFFGGPGNNYSLHALAGLVRILRRDRNAFGVIGANGGFLTKHSVGVYSTTPPASPFAPSDDRAVQARLDASPGARWTETGEGEAVIETYTVTHKKGAPHRSHVIATMKSSGLRTLAVTAAEDRETPFLMDREDMLGATVFIRPEERGNSFTIVKPSPLAR